MSLAKMKKSQSKRSMIKKICATTILSMVSILGMSASANAQGYPNKPIRVLVPFAPGGVVDITARLLTQKMTERLGWNFVVENRPGGNGFIAVGAAAKSAPDGYTLLMAHTGEFAGNPALFSNIPYELERDFTPITMVSDTPMLLVANSNTPYNSVKEVLAYAKQNPGKLSFSSPGNGSVNHLAGEWLWVDGGVNVVHIPYKGGSPAVAAVASGEVPLGVVAIPAVMPHVKSGRVKVLGLTTSSQSAYDPTWQTTKQSGLPNVNASNWVGLFAPKGLPVDVMSTLQKAVIETLQSPDVQKRFADNGATIGGMSSAEFTARIKADALKYKEVVEKAKVTVQ
jgi:tripartite-type tricarboxylate transporter receptor subunit TctC